MQACRSAASTSHRFGEVQWTHEPDYAQWLPHLSTPLPVLCRQARMPHEKSTKLPCNTQKHRREHNHAHHISNMTGERGHPHDGTTSFRPTCLACCIAGERLRISARTRSWHGKVRLVRGGLLVRVHCDGHLHHLWLGSHELGASGHLDLADCHGGPVDGGVRVRCSRRAFR